MNHTVDTIRSFLEHRPFRPFTFETNNGDTHTIEDSCRTAIGNATMTYYPLKSDRSVVIQIRDIRTLHPLGNSPSDLDRNLLDRVRELKHQKPFRVFKIVLKGQLSWTITNPDGLALRESSLVWCQSMPSRVVHIPLKEIRDIVVLND